MTILLDTTRLPVKPAGYNTYVVFLDSDGDFSSGASRLPLSKTAEGYEATAVDISDDQYITFGILHPVIQFGQSTSNGDESSTPAQILISIKYPVTEDVSIKYLVDTALSTATPGDDYTISDSIATIPAGDTSINNGPT